MTDYRKDQRVIATLSIEDKGQDFLELDVLENGVILGESIMFKDGCISLLGIGTPDGTKYFDFNYLKSSQTWITEGLKGLTVYIKSTGESDPLPWNAKTLNYKVTGVLEVKNADRFIKKEEDEECQCECHFIDMSEKYALTTNELKAKAKELDLPTSGTKADLIERITLAEQAGE